VPSCRRGARLIWRVRRRLSESRCRTMAKAACACCGFLVLDERGSYAICPICFWEDDIVQIADPWCEGGAKFAGSCSSSTNVCRDWSDGARLPKACSSSS
jgi:hypothetical protein